MKILPLGLRLTEGGSRLTDVSELTVMPMMPRLELIHDNRDACCETAKQSSIRKHFIIHDRYPSVGEIDAIIPTRRPGFCIRRH
jgi:hypothetical protein